MVKEREPEMRVSIEPLMAECPQEDGCRVYRSTGWLRVTVESVGGTVVFDCQTKHAHRRLKA